MQTIFIAYSLPFTSVKIRANGGALVLNRVLIDTGSASTVFNTDHLEVLGVFAERTDRIRFMRGIGGREPVVEKEIEAIEVGDLIAGPFTIEMGALAYGYEIDGILGSNFLLRVGAQINFKTLTLEKA